MRKSRAKKNRKILINPELFEKQKPNKVVMKIIKICKDERILENLKNIRNKLNEQRKVGKYCDYMLKTEDGGNFTVHKSVLETVCPFFERMFNSKFKDKDAESVLMKRCSSSAVLEKIVEFMYTGQVKISSDIAKETLDAALFLELNTLVDTCTEILVEIVDCENCFELLAYSGTYHSGGDLTEKCAKTIQKYIEELQGSLSFIELPEDLMKTMLSYRHNECDEEQLFSAVVNWIMSDIGSREQSISTLMDLIKFEKISYEFRQSKILQNNPLLEYKDFQVKIVELLSKSCGDQVKGKELQKIMNNIKLNDICTFVGYEVRLHQNDNFSSHSFITQIPDYRSDFAYATCEGEILFICGGIINGSSTKSCKYYSIKENCWTDLSSMSYQRYKHRMIALNKKLYVCGGGNQTLEIFDIGESKWTSGPAFYNFTLPFGLCSMNGCIYALNKDELQCYDPKQNGIMTLSAYKLEEINSALSYNNNIYGFTERGIATFDIRKKSWINFKFYEGNVMKNNPEICVTNNKCYMMSWLTENANHARYDISVYNLSDFSLFHHYGLYKSSNLSATKSYGILSFE